MYGNWQLLLSSGDDLDQKARDLMFESGSVENTERSYNIVWEY